MPKIKDVRHIIPISGKDSLATAIVQTAIDNKLPYEYLFCDVGRELPETYDWLFSVEKKMGFVINRVGRSLSEIIAEHNMLPSHQRRFCTREGKIFPIRDYIGGDEAVQYIGIRADENRAGAGSFGQPNVTFKFPLVEMGIDLPAVYGLLESRGIMPPQFFWKKLWDAVYDYCGDYSRRYMDAMPAWVKANLFSWRSRSNCFDCFYQRLYELVGLLEYHPDLFEQGEKMEYDYGCRESPLVSAVKTADFFMHQNWPMWKIRASADMIFQKRVRAVVKAVVKSRQSIDDDASLIETVSCGLYCGK